MEVISRRKEERQTQGIEKTYYKSSFTWVIRARKEELPQSSRG